MRSTTGNRNVQSRKQNRLSEWNFVPVNSTVICLAHVLMVNGLELKHYFELYPRTEKQINMYCDFAAASKHAKFVNLKHMIFTGSKMLTMFFYVFTETDLVPDAKPPVAKPPISVPRKCPQNEVLKSRFSCPPDTCDTIYLSFLCIANQTETVMCTCKDGYLRTNSTGVCVPVDRCLPRKYNLSYSASATSLILKGTHHVGQFKSKVYPSLGQENLNY